MNSVYAFDCFDTLVSRDCHPEVVLFSWAKNLASKLSFYISPQNLYSWRKEIEKIQKKQNGIEEISYNVLLDKLYTKCILYNENIKMSKEEFLSISYDIERNIEIRHLHLNKEMIEILKSAKQEKRKIILISDFYMGSVFFEDIFKHFDILSCFDKFYISSDIGKRKSSGNLYKYILTDLKVNPSDIKMHGDNRVSDVLVPQSLGIIAKQVDILMSNRFYKKAELYTCMKKQLHCKKQHNLFSGCSAPLLLMMDRLYKKSVEKNVKTLLFCSREGQNLKKLFDIYQKSIYSENIIKTQYFYVSRRSTLLPSLKEIKDEKFSRIFRQYKELTLYDFMYTIGFNVDEINNVLKLIGCLGTEIVESPENGNVILNKLFANDFFLSVYNKKRIEQNNLFKEYILSLIEADNETIHLVDIGWKGTIQDNIFEIVGSNKDLQGYYFGLLKKTEKSNNKKQGLLFDSDSSKENIDVFSYNCIELERVFAANHGQTLSYKKCGDMVQPVISDSTKDIDIYRYVQIWQDNMNVTFENTVQCFYNSLFEPEDLKVELTKIYIYHLCVTQPKYYKSYLNFRKIDKENYGSISGARKKNNDGNTRDHTMKKKYAYVDYTYRILDKLHLPFLKLIANFYCHIVYCLKVFMIK